MVCFLSQPAGKKIQQKKTKLNIRKKNKHQGAKFERFFLSMIQSLQPFHPSTAYDGYSVTDYMGVDPANGSWADLQQFFAEQNDSRFNLMFDLVLNHCSVQHPWFKQFVADESPGSKSETSTNFFSEKGEN